MHRTPRERRSRRIARVWPPLPLRANYSENEAKHLRALLYRPSNSERGLWKLANAESPLRNIGSSGDRHTLLSRAISPRGRGENKVYYLLN